MRWYIFIRTVYRARLNVYHRRREIILAISYKDPPNVFRSRDFTQIRTRFYATRSDKQLEALNDWSSSTCVPTRRLGPSGSYWKRFRAGPKNSPKRLRASRKMNYSRIVSWTARCRFEERRRSLSLGIWSVDIGADTIYRVKILDYRWMPSQKSVIFKSSKINEENRLSNRKKENKAWNAFKK